MQIQDVYVPSVGMIDRHGTEAEKHAQDQRVCIGAVGEWVLAVVDGARNFLGETEYLLPGFASRRGLPGETLLNGGEIVSSLFATHIESQAPQSGKNLIQTLNQELARCYQALGIQPDLRKRGELFTGYVGQVHITPRLIEVTSVGDCYVAVNGEIVAGEEKEVDKFNARLVEEVARFYQIGRQRAYEGIMPFVNAVQFDLQNDPKKANWYPAIDGTHTPEAAITWRRFPTSEVETIVLWTDGFTPVGSEVRGLEDLRPTDPVYGERTAIIATGVNQPE